MLDGSMLLTLAAGDHDYPLITTLAAGFTAAWLLGLVAQKIGLSPIVGYLLAGILIGPYTPGYIADVELAPQLAELGVILLMFGVGLHFHLKDLLAVKTIAIPGAVGQSAVATVAGALVFMAFDWPLTAGLVVGMAMAVASTVVLLRVLMDADQLNTAQGHAAVGWLIVEDIFTVVVLVVIPALAGQAVLAETMPDVVGGGVPPAQVAADGPGTTPSQAPTEATAGVLPEAGDSGTRIAAAAEAEEEAQVSAIETAEAEAAHWAVSLGSALVKLSVLVVLLLWGGPKVAPWILVKVAKLRSRELFTLTVLVMSIAIASASATIFGASMALGAFLAGMVVAQSPVSQQAGVDALPLRDAFAVLFFVAVGMLMDPMFVVHEPGLMLAGLGIVMIAKPIAALVIVGVLGFPLRTGLTVAVCLAQIGEFSFIVGDVAFRYGLIPEEARHLLVACALVSITLNPILFRGVAPLESWLRRRPKLWAVLNARSERRLRRGAAEVVERVQDVRGRLAIVVGYGPVGRQVDRLLREAGFETTIIDLNMDVVAALNAEGRNAIFGDAAHQELLEQAGAEKASHLLLTAPHAGNRAALLGAARTINPDLRVLVRTRFLREEAEAKQYGANATVVDEVESAVALAEQVLAETGADEGSTRDAAARIRRELSTYSAAHA